MAELASTSPPGWLRRRTDEDQPVLLVDARLDRVAERRLARGVEAGRADVRRDELVDRLVVLAAHAEDRAVLTGLVVGGLALVGQGGGAHVAADDDSRPELGDVLGDRRGAPEVLGSGGYVARIVGVGVARGVRQEDIRGRVAEHAPVERVEGRRAGLGLPGEQRGLLGRSIVQHGLRTDAVRRELGEYPVELRPGGLLAAALAEPGAPEGGPGLRDVTPGHDRDEPGQTLRHPELAGGVFLRVGRTARVVAAEWVTRVGERQARREGEGSDRDQHGRPHGCLPSLPTKGARARGFRQAFFSCPRTTRAAELTGRMTLSYKEVP